MEKNTGPEQQSLTVYVEEDETELLEFDSQLVIFIRSVFIAICILIIPIVSIKLFYGVFMDRVIAGDCGDPPGIHEPEKRIYQKFSGGYETHFHPSYFEMLLNGRGAQIYDELTLEPKPYEQPVHNQVTFN